MAIAYNSNYEGTMPFSDTVAQVACTVNAEQTFTVPGTIEQQFQALFTYASNSNVYVRLNDTPTVPAAGSVSTQPYSEFKPYKKYVRGGDVLHFITPDTTAYIGLTLSQLQG